MLEDAIRIQRVATDPGHSAWVEANAGSGKTHVLVDRIARLLLEGTPPDRLLCLTFTRAAASEMLARLFKRLGDWTLQADEDLAKSLASLTGERPTPKLLKRARRLFASLESPGGLRIQTIHAFCERLLKRFPLEAGVAPQFAVLDDVVSNELLSDARDELLRLAQNDAQLAEDIYELTAHSGEERFDTIMRAVARDRGVLTKFLAELPIDHAVQAIFKRTGATPGMTEEGLFEHASRCLSADLARRIADAYSKGGKKDLDRVPAFRAFAASPTAETFRDVAACFLTKEGEMNVSLAGKKSLAADPDAMERLQEIATAGYDATLKVNGLFVADRTARLVRVASRMLTNFAIAKRRRAALDYDDLIVRTRQLFDQPGADWILYKLDGGIDHILVDEAQDTSPVQWEVITPIAQEFFAGQGADRKGRSVNRTMFAVGDVKQSIMSFQGADPEAFVSTHKLAEEAARGARLGFENVTLDRSFRSAPKILELVDAVFANKEAQEGVTFADQAVDHIAIREDIDGLVELWPAIKAEDTPEQVAWDAPRDRPTDKHPPVILAQTIADRIGAWIKNGEAVFDNQSKSLRRMNAGDIMILVRRRGFFAEEMIRQLKKRAIPVAGADRLQLVSHIAIKDLIALGRFALMPRDDLTLAALLKSPFCGVSEQALFELAYDRGKASLWDRLRERRTDMVFSTAADFLESVRKEVDYKQPFEFYADILSAQGGWRHVLERLGLDAADPIDEFMNAALEYEIDHTPSLEGFLHWIETTDTEIKRDQDRTAGAVRVMTVHAAKGLEAPVVILPDTCTTPENGRHDLEFLDAEGVPLWKIDAWREVPPRRAAREAAKRERMKEYRRLLYVALTRPRDRLYVCGFETKVGRGREDGCWYDLVETAMKALDAATVTMDEHSLQRFGAVPEMVSSTAKKDVAEEPLPPWVRVAASSERLMPPINPSDAVRSSRPAALSATRKIDLGPALERGRVIHRLLEVLAPIGEAAWNKRALAFATALIDDPDIARAAAEEALRVRADPAFAHLFALGSQGEVSLRGRIAWQGRQVDLLARVDRIVVEPARVLIVEFKTDRAVPATIDEVSQGYVTQLALYARAAAALFPERDVECAVLWTVAPRLDTISSRKLEAAERALDPLWGPS